MNFKVNEINYEKYDQHYFKTSQNYSIFYDKNIIKYLNKNHGLKCYEVCSDNKKLALIFNSKKNSLCNFFHFQQGIIFSDSINNYLEFRKFYYKYKIILFFLKYLKHKKEKLFIFTDTHFFDLRSFLDFGKFDYKPKFTACVDLKKFDKIEDYLKIIRRDRRQDLNLNNLLNIKIFNENYSSGIVNFIKKNSKNTIDKPILNLLKILNKKKLANFFVAREFRKIVSIQFCLKDTNKIYLVMHCTNSNYLKKGLSVQLFFYLIKFYFKEKKILDFCGANSYNLSDFKHSLGARLSLFFNISQK